MAGDAKRATLKDVAREAGVSVGMASRVLGSYGYFSDDTKEKVTEAAQALGYRPNIIARSLRKGTTKALGVLVSNIASFHWTTFVQGVEEAASRHGYQVILGNTDDDPDMERLYLSALYERNVDGIVVSPVPENLVHLDTLAQGGFPMLLVDTVAPELDVPTIAIDDHAAAYRATDYLLGLGHRRIGIVTGSQQLASGVDRLNGYRDALLDHGLEALDELIAPGEYRFEQAYQATRQLLSLATRPTALLVCNERMTGAALQCLKDLRVAIPDDLSLIGFDDPAWASFYNPSLTTVRNPRHRIGTLAVEKLLASMKGPTPGGSANRPLMIDTELVIRESCLPLRD